MAQLMPVYRQQGRVGHLEPEVRAAIARFPGLPTLSCNLALLLADTGRADEAGALIDWLSEADFAVMPRDSLVLASWAILGEATVVLGDADRARPIAAALAPHARVNLIQGAPVGWGSGAWHLSRLAWVCGEREKARRYAEQARRLHEHWGAAGWGPALAGLESAGATAPLSPREREVLGLLAAGRANKEIAAALHLSVHTVERHVANIFTKLGLRNRAEATSWAHRQRLMV